MLSFELVTESFTVLSENDIDFERVEITSCGRCGALLGDVQVHLDFHNEIGH